MNLDIRDVDRRYFADRLAGFLPPRMIDVHTHVWLDAFKKPADTAPRGPTWPGRVAAEQTVEELDQTYEAFFPGTKVTPVLLGMPTRDVDLNKSNNYVAECAGRRRYPSLMVSAPEWPAEEVERLVQSGGFLGLKPYLELAPPHIPSAEVQIYDFLPRPHLAVADKNGWAIMLHIPRPARLSDPVNLRQMLEIERDYPNIKMIYAHIGRAYCPEDVGNAMKVLGETRRLAFDFSANTCGEVMERVLRAMGPRRLLLGSDLPIVRMRMRRICEEGGYVNLVPRGLYGDVSNDPRMREVDDEEGSRLSFFFYEILSAFRQAAESVGLSKQDVSDVLYGNAARIFGLPA